MAALIDTDGVITFEFPHLLNLLKNCQFDTIYHEHYSYLSITALLPIFEQYELKVFEVEKLPTHGGSLRVYLKKTECSLQIGDSVNAIIEEELQYDPRDIRIYKLFQDNVSKTKSDLVKELHKLKENGKKISAYGAAAKGITLLNYCGIDCDVIDFVVDLNPSKQGKFIPGSKIPIVDSNILASERPDVLLILAWNLSTEIKSQLNDYIKLGMKLIKAVPEVAYF